MGEISLKNNYVIALHLTEIKDVQEVLWTMDSNISLPQESVPNHLTHIPPRWLSRIMLSFILLKILFHNQFILRLCWSIYLIICLERKTRLCCSRCLRLVILYRWNLIQLWNFS